MKSFCLQRRSYVPVLSALVIAVSVGAPYKFTADGRTLQSDDVSLPDKKGAWMVSVEHGGGMVYRWDGATINSDGEIVVRIGRRPRGSGTASTVVVAAS